MNRAEKTLQLHELRRDRTASAKRPSNVVDGLLEIGIVPRKGERRTIVAKCVGEVAAAIVDVRQAAKCRQILRRAPQHARELHFRAVEIVGFEKGSTERYTCGKVPRVNGEPGAADCDGVMKIAAPPVLFPELRKSKRRRVLVDPAAKLVDATIVSHGINLALSDGDGERCRPRLPSFVSDDQDHDVGARLGKFV